MAQYTKEDILGMVRQNLGAKDDWDAICRLVNEHRNYSTAICWIFELSWLTNKDWLQACTDEFRKWVTSNLGPDNKPAIVDSGDISNWVTWYTTNVSQPPTA